MDPTRKLTPDGLSMTGADLTTLWAHCDRLLTEQILASQSAWSLCERAEIDSALPRARAKSKGSRL